MKRKHQFEVANAEIEDIKLKMQVKNEVQDWSCKWQQSCNQLEMARSHVKMDEMAVPFPKKSPNSRWKCENDGFWKVKYFFGIFVCLVPRYKILNVVRRQFYLSTHSLSLFVSPVGLFIILVLTTTVTTRNVDLKRWLWHLVRHNSVFSI